MISNLAEKISMAGFFIDPHSSLKQKAPPL